MTGIRRSSLLVALGTAAALCTMASAAVRAQTQIRIKGAAEIGELLGPDLAKAYAVQHPEVQIEWESLGSGTAFVGLVDGSADLGASSIPVQAAELAQARRLGIPLSEYVIGYDAVAVIAHPSNSVSELSLEQLADLFAGKAQSWRAIGGPNLAVNPVSLPTYSGAHVLFAQRVLHRDAETSEKFSDVTRFVESSDDVVKAVLTNRRAVAYVGLGFIGQSKVKALAIGSPGQAVTPSARSIHDGTYPFSRVLYLYARGEPSGPLREFISFVLSAAGQEVVASKGLIPRDAPAPLPALVPTGTAAQVQPPTRIAFRYKSIELGAEDREALDQLATPLLDGSHHLLVIGHADGVAPRANNPRYARERAEIVAEYLRRKGVSPDSLEIAERAESQPLASNESESGRSLNRRVDLWLVPLPALASAPAAFPPPAR